MLWRCDRGGERGQEEKPGPPSSILQLGQGDKVWPESWTGLWRTCSGLRAAVCLANQSVWWGERAGVGVQLQRGAHPGTGRLKHGYLFSLKTPLGPWQEIHFLWCNPALRPQALVCSCFIPIYCGLIPPSFRGVVGIWLTVFSSWFSLGFSLWNAHFAQNVFHNVYVTLFASLYGIEAILWEACHEKESLKKKKNGNHSHACFRKMSNWQSRTGNPNE